MLEGENYFILQQRRVLCMDLIEGYEKHIRRLQLVIANIDDSLEEYRPPPKRGYITNLITHALEKAGSKGIDAGEVLFLAASEKHKISRKTVASILSRMKTNKTVKFENTRYVKIEYSENNGL